MFGIGDIVVCVDASPDDKDPRANLLTEKKIYRVGAAGQRIDGEYALAFHCIPSSPGKGYAFCARRFRKVERASSKFSETMRALRPALALARGTS